MAITNPTAPEEGRQIVSDNVSQILRTQIRGAGAILRDVRSEELVATDPHKSYFVSLKDLASGHLLDAARPTAWRYLIIQGHNAVAEVELNADEKTGRTLEFIGLHQSPFANATLEALREAEALSQIRKQNYELRYLKIPSVYLAAVWLYSQVDDILIPLKPAPAELQANRAYSQNEFVEILRPIARDAEKFDRTFEHTQSMPSEG